MASQQELKIKVEATGISETKGKLQQMGGATDNAGASFGTMAAKVVSATAILYAAKEAIGTVIQVGGDFEQALANLSAVTGSTGTELASLEQQAKDLGATSVFTASNIAELQTEFGKLGFPTEEILGMTGATSDLAAAIGDDLGVVAVTVGSTMNQFGLDSEDTTKTTDTMAAAFSQSALDLDKLSNSLTYVGPIAGNMNLPLADTTALLGVLANSGLDGSIAGTALKSVLLDLGDSTSKLGEKLGYAVTDSDSLSSALEDLSVMTFEEGEMMELVGKRAIPAFQTLLAGVSDVEALTAALENSAGTAQRMAEVQLDTLQGKMKIMTSATEGLAVALFERMAPGLKTGVDAVTDFIGAIADWVQIPLSEKMEEEQGHMNALFGMLDRTNISEERRAEILSELNTDYKEYLPNLLTEKTSLEDIETARLEANKAFMGAIVLQANEEKLQEIVSENKDLMGEYGKAMLDREKALNKNSSAVDTHMIALDDLNESLGTNMTMEEASAYIITRSAERNIELAEKGINQRTGMLKSNAKLTKSYSEQETQFLNTAQAIQTTSDELYDAEDAESVLREEMNIVTEELDNQTKAYNKLSESLGVSTEKTNEKTDTDRAAAAAAATTVAKNKEYKGVLNQLVDDGLVPLVSAWVEYGEKIVEAGEPLLKHVTLSEESVEKMIAGAEAVKGAISEYGGVAMSVLQAEQDAMNAKFENEKAVLEETHDLAMEVFDAKLEAGEEALEEELKRIADLREADLGLLEEQLENLELLEDAALERLDAELEALEDQHDVVRELEEAAMDLLEEQHQTMLDNLDDELDTIKANHDAKRDLMDDELKALNALHGIKDDALEDEKIAMDAAHLEAKRNMEDRQAAELEMFEMSGASSEELKELKAQHAAEEKDFRRQVEDDKIEYAAKKLEESRNQEQEMADLKAEHEEEERKMAQETADKKAEIEKQKQIQETETEALRIEQAAAEKQRQDDVLAKEKANDEERETMRDDIADKELELVDRKAELLDDEIEAKEQWAADEAIIRGDKLAAEEAHIEEMMALEEEQKKESKKLRKAEIIMQTASGAISSFASLSGIPVIGPPLGAIAAAAIVAYGADQLKELEKAQEGGFLGGRPHTEGGTIIEAEKGEYVINKKSVDILGADHFEMLNSIKSESDVENLEKMMKLQLREGGLISKKTHKFWKNRVDDARWWKVISKKTQKKLKNILAKFEDGGQVEVAPIVDGFEGGGESRGGETIFNITITAPLLDEHVVDELIPRIDEAFRRGERFKYLD